MARRAEGRERDRRRVEKRSDELAERASETTKVLVSDEASAGETPAEGEMDLCKIEQTRWSQISGAPKPFIGFSLP